MTHGADVEQRVRALLREHPDMPRTDMAQSLGISRKTLYKHLGRIEAQPQVETVPSPEPASPKAEKGGMPQKKEPHLHDGRRQNKGKPPPGPNATSYKPGHPPGPGRPSIHGLFARFTPDALKEALAEAEESDELTLLKAAYRLQLMSIARAQEIMHVIDANDDTVEVTFESSAESKQKTEDSKGMATHYARDKYGAYLAAISRANATLSNMSKQIFALEQAGGGKKRGLADLIREVVGTG